jgi:hypothetical protein
MIVLRHWCDVSANEYIIATQHIIGFTTVLITISSNVRWQADRINS